MPPVTRPAPRPHPTDPAEHPPGSANARAPSSGLLIAGLVTVQVFFGINYIASKVVVEAIPPLVWAGVRTGIAAVLLAVLALVLKRPMPRGRRFFRSAVGFALLSIVFNQGCFLVGLRHTTSTNSALLNTLIPVFTLAIVILRGHEHLTRSKLASFLAAFAGVCLLLHIEDLHLGTQTLLGDLLTLLNSLSYGLYLAYSKPFLERYDRIWITVWLFAFGSLGLNLIAIPSWIGWQPPVMTSTLWLACAFVILGGTFLTYLLTNLVLAHVEASRVAIYVYIQPVVAALLAWSLRGEAITPRTIVGSGCIFLGVYLSSRPAIPQP